MILYNKMNNKTKIRNIFTYAFPNRKALIDYVEDKESILIAVNAEKILEEDVKLHNIINNNIAYADGFGAVMALRKKGLDAIKIPGAELWLDIINRFYLEKSFYFIGSSQDVIEKTILKLKDEFNEINIVGYRNGFLKKEDKIELIQELKQKKPEIIFVAQGSPRQEFLMDELMKEYPALYMGLGGSFDVYCGLKQRAPDFFLRFNLEWFYRLISEPTRYKRQLGLVKFYIYLKLGRL